MANLLQSFFVEIEGQHSAIPYNSVKLVCKSIYPEISEDKRLLISICLCSLHYNNPGAGFFEVINILKANPYFDGRDLYRHFCKTSTIRYKRKVITIRELQIKLIDEYRTNIQAAIQYELEYYSKVFENVKMDAESSHHTLLDCLYNDGMSLDEKINYLQDFYGFPFIETPNHYLMPQVPKEDLLYKEYMFIRGLEIIINRFVPKMTTASPSYDPKCDMYERCNASQYDPDILDKDRAPMTKDCENKQWNKTEDVCLMTAALKWHNLWGKEIDQPYLPEDMR
jgi:hypothetical protein